ncbi:2-dehydropantoate 2-reductase [Dyella solisilvae]|uniref:2-dehydropantoate 2-reductase n=1 Tax=Dyella solisilvae TaxID=1920168 RepID=A0A370K9A9_9GAMM|nr:2-dehydropantoate 2-reductase [Dyella solisilvae]
MPRIAIYGAGSVGGYLGARLHEHARVTFIGRHRVIDTLRLSGISWSDLHGGSGRIGAKALDLQLDPFAAAKAHLVLVTVKCSATAAVARELAEVLAPGVPVISLQNGLHNAKVLRAALPGHPVLAGMVPFNVLRRDRGSFHQGSSGQLMVEADPSLAPFLPLFANAGLPIATRNDMPAVLAAKLLLNLNNAINALSDLPLREELSQRRWRRCLALAQREALAVFTAAGIHPARLTPLPARFLPHVLELPDTLFQRVAAKLLAIDPLARSSTWEDLESGRATEVDAINGEIVRLAAQHGMTAPVNARLVALIRQSERRRTTWQSEQLLQELRQSRPAYERPMAIL